jgi:aminoglycoside phosphotransferase (APT) family kinase protein
MVHRETRGRRDRRDDPVTGSRSVIRENELSAGELSEVARLMAAVGAEPRANLTANFLAGGRSNLTYRIDDGVKSWVLRMPPRSGRTPSAHDVAREFRVTSALSGSVVPVARPLILCEDESVIGTPFIVVEHVTGTTVRTASDLEELDDQTVAAVTTRLVETLAALHRIEPEVAGLEGYGRPEGYAARQLKRWTGQWELVGTDAGSTSATELSRRLSARVPQQGGASIVHGDFRIDNVILQLPGAAQDPQPQVAAVVDWELSTLGDPVADVAMMCAYRVPIFDLIVGEPSAWTSPRIPPVHGLAEAYSAAGGLPLRDWEFHLALAYFKIAVIAAGIAHRAQAGAASGRGFDTAGDAVCTYLELGLDTLQAMDGHR